jgi:hypothetical protein
LAIAKQQYLDGIVVHLELRDIAPLHLIEEIQKYLVPHAPPVMVLATRVLTPAEDVEFARLSRAGVLKRANTLERLLDDSVLLLHRAETDLTPDQRRIVEYLRRSDPALDGRTVLVVDDDVRNIFALTSLLEEHNLNVVHAENGRPGMDGYETMSAVRQIPRFRSLPIVALTAKAMKGDRAKCIEAGASDYITKPVDLEQLFSVLRVWMSSDQHDASPLAAPAV